MPDLDACTSCEVNQFRIVKPVDFGVVILGRVNDTPVIVLINVWIQGNLLLCRLDQIAKRTVLELYTLAPTRIIMEVRM